MVVTSLTDNVAVPTETIATTAPAATVVLGSCGIPICMNA